MLRDEEGWEVVREQQPPTPNDRPAVWPEIIKLLEQRHKDGVAKYGVPLQPFNGRKPLVDLFQELADALAYCYQEMMEREQEKSIVGDSYALTVLVAERDESRMLVQSLTAAREADQRELRTIKSERDEAKEKLAEIGRLRPFDRIINLKRKLAERRKERDNAYTTLDHFKRALVEANGELETARQVIASNGQALCKLQAEKDEAWRQIDALTEERDGLREEVEHLRGSVVDTCYSHGNDRLRLNQAERERDDLGKQIAEARAGLVAVTEERDRIALKLDLTLAERDAARKELSQVKAERDGWKDDHERMTAVCESNFDDCLKAREQRDAACRERDEARKLLASEAAQRDELRSLLEEVTGERDRALANVQKHAGDALRLKDELAAFRKVVQVIADPPK